MKQTNPSWRNMVVFMTLLISLVLAACSQQKTSAAYNTYQYLVSFAGGLGSADAAAIRRIHGVRYCEGGFAFQGTTEWEGSPISVWYRSIPVKLTNLTLTQGRMPVRVGEGAVSAELFAQSGLCLGDRLPVDKNALYCDGLTIVGVVEDAWETEPGLYMTGDSFRQTGYSHMYVLVPDAEQETAVEAALTALAEKREAAWLETEKKRIQEDMAANQKVYDAIDGSAREPLEAERSKLEDARSELEANRKKLNDAKAQLGNAHAQLSDADAQLKSGRKQLQSARAELDAANQALEDYGAQLDGARLEIEEKERQLAAFRQQLDSSRNAYQDALAQIGMTDGQLEAAYAEASSGLDAANAALSELDAAITQCDSGIQACEAEILSAQTRIQELKSQMEDVKDGEAFASLAAEQLQQTKRIVAAQALQQELEAQRRQAVAAQEPLRKTVSQLQETKDALEALLHLREQLSRGEAEYTDGATALSAAKEQHSAMEEEYRSQMAAYDANEELYASSCEELERKEYDYSVGLSRYQSNMRSFTQQESAFQEKEQEFLDAQQQFADAEQQLLDQLQPIADEIQALSVRLEQLIAPKWVISNRSTNENG